MNIENQITSSNLGSKSFKKAKNVTTTTLTGSIQGLKKGTIYYVKVKAYKVDSAGNKVYSSNYSKVKTVEIDR